MSPPRLRRRRDGLTIRRWDQNLNQYNKNLKNVNLLFLPPLLRLRNSNRYRPSFSVFFFKQRIGDGNRFMPNARWQIFH